MKAILNPSLVQEYDKRNRNPAGKLYMPSYRYGIETKAPNGAEASNAAKTEQEAKEKAQSWCLGESGRSAIVYRRRDPMCRGVIHYWNDGQLQYVLF